jgi:hypothetical protein
MRFLRHFLTVPIYPPPFHQYGLNLPAIPPFPLHQASALTTFCLAQRKASFFTVRHEKSILFDVAQYPLALNLFSKAFQQLLLRLTGP